MAKLTVKPLADLLLKSAPDQGNGLHRWLMEGARMCERAADRIELMITR